MILDLIFLIILVICAIRKSSWPCQKPFKCSYGYFGNYNNNDL